MAINPTLNFTVPQPDVPFATSEGGVSIPWLYYLIGLWRRTGGSQGIPSDRLQDQINALFAEVAMEDVDFPPPPVSLAALLAFAMNEDPPPVNVTFPLLFSQAMSDPPPRPGLDPIMAALAVSDAT